MSDTKNFLNMKLEDEPFLNSKPNFQKDLIELHKRGIYTLNDFMTMDLKTIPKKETRKTFLRLISILNYKYLGKDLVCDVLLEKSYPSTYQEFLNLKEKNHYPDATEGNFHVYVIRALKEDCLALGIPFKLVIYRKLLHPRTKKNTLTMDDYLEDISIKNSCEKYLVDFYLDYISSKTDKEKENMTSKELKDLKKQLLDLTSQRDALTKQIETITRQIQTMSEGKKNAKK